MTPIRHLGWTALALVALVGCEAPTPPAPPTTPPGSSPAGAPEAGKPTTETKPAAEPGKDATEIKSVPVEPTPPGGTKADEPKKEGASVNKLSDEEIAEIKKLPANEQAIALAQVSCPVEHGHLGEMGVPIKQVIGDKTFFICCSGCAKKVKSNPDEVLADLAKLKK